MSAKPKPIPSPPSPPTKAIRRSDPATPLELWYLQCLKLLTHHLKRPPSLTELSTYCKRAVTPCYVALLRLEAKGYVARRARKGAGPNKRRFEVVA